VGELTARVRAALRRSAQPESESVFQKDDLLVDLARRNVLKQGQAVSLTPTEYDILRVLVQHAGKVMTHEQLIHSIWGSESVNDEENSHLLRVNISNLRRKLEIDPSRPRYIVTEPGVGYRLKTI
jgi:two-component system KDP operon response regulator KdpE